MTREEFTRFRKRLEKTQKQIAELLGSSLKAIHSYEQGWRNIPPHVQRQLLFLLAQKKEWNTRQRKCWSIKKCPQKRRKNCPAWEFQVGKLCWFINGTICEGNTQRNWAEKMSMCRACEIFLELIE